jgi:hypothetical protein
MRKGKHFIFFVWPYWERRYSSVQCHRCSWVRSPSDPHDFACFSQSWKLTALVTRARPFTVSFAGFFKVMRRVQDRIYVFRIYSIGVRMIRHRWTENRSPKETDTTLVFSGGTGNTHSWSYRNSYYSGIVLEKWKHAVAFIRLQLPSQYWHGRPLKTIKYLR